MKRILFSEYASYKIKSNTNMMDILKAAVYCGTYGKYAAGNLTGGWLKLTDYKNSGEFLDACSKLHPDESSPEFMFQDTEYLPPEFYSEDCIYPEVFDVINAIKQMDEQQRTAFEAFCEDNACIPDMYDIEEFLNAYTPNKKPLQSFPSLAEDINKYHQLAHSDAYDKKLYCAAIEFQPCRFIRFEKPEIEKEFCWGYGMQGMTEEEAEECRNSFDNEAFICENLERFDSELLNKDSEVLNSPNIRLGLCAKRNEAEVYYIKSPRQWDYNREDDIVLNSKESALLRNKYLTTVSEIRTDFEKRIKTYLKRYGLSKVRTWTYWADE